MPDNRELATAILFAALVIVGLPIAAVRKQVPTLLRTAGSLSGLFVFYLATCGAVLWLAAQVGLWSTALWWPTGVIVFGVGVGLTAKAIQARNAHKVLESVPAETVAATVLIVLYSTLVGLPLFWELVLQAAAALFASVGVVAARQNNVPGKRLCDIVLIAIGLIFFATTTIELARGMPADAWSLLAQDTLMSFWLPFALLPFLYIVTYYSAVEGAVVNVRVRQSKAGRGHKHPLIARLFFAFRLRVAWANGFDQTWGQRYAQAEHRRARVQVLAAYRRTRAPKLGSPWWKRDISTAPWDGRAMPRNERHTKELVASRPPGWEYMLFGATLWTAMLALEPQYQDHRRKTPHPQPDGDARKPMVRLRGSLDRAASLGDRVSDIVGYDNEQHAFGAPGSPGDVDAIRRLSTRLVQVYAEFMDWAARLRGERVPAEYRGGFEAAARLADGPIRQLRGFVVDVALQVDRLPAHIANPQGKQLSIELPVKLSVDDADARRLRRRMARLERRATEQAQQTVR